MRNTARSSRTTGRGYALLQPKIRGNLVGARTRLVLEGFPRSANTYALAAFRCANGSGPAVASHLHSAASVAEGLRRRLPVLVVIRDPVDACASLIQRQQVTAHSALVAYVRFHLAVLGCLDSIVVSDFMTTTTSFGSAVRAINGRFGTSYIPYEATEVNERWCRDFVEEADRTDQGASRPHTVALPRASRSARGEAIKRSILLQEPHLVDEARSLYREIASASA